MASEAKRLEFSVSTDGHGRFAEAGHSLDVADALSAEGLLLASLLRCSLTSLAHFARREGVEVETTSAEASCVVTRREDDRRYAVVEVTATLDVELAPEPDDVRALLASAEWACFVGASLTAKPSYRWRVNGADV